MTSQSEKAKLFHELHCPGQPLVLTNVWDAASARLVADAGASAIAAYAAVKRAAEEVYASGTYGALADGLGYAEINGLFEG